MTQFARICNKRKITVKQLPTYQISHSGEKRKSGKPKNKVKSAAKEKRRKSAEKLTENMQQLAVFDFYCYWWLAQLLIAG